MVKMTIKGGLTSFYLMVYFFTFGAIMLWVYVFFSGYHIETPKELSQIIKIILVAALVVGGFWSLFESYRLVDNTGLTRAILSVNIVVAFLLSNIIFGAKINWIDVGGSILIISGIILMSFR